MLLDDTFHIIHTAIAHLYGVSVENFVVSVIIGKVFLYQVEEHLSYLGFHRFTEWGVKLFRFRFLFLWLIPACSFQVGFPMEMYQCFQN